MFAGKPTDVGGWNVEEVLHILYACCDPEIMLEISSNDYVICTSMVHAQALSDEYFDPRMPVKRRRSNDV